MSQLTSIFVATPTELDACFPDFRLALSEPTVREGRNPATGDPLRVEMWDPGTESDPADFQDAQGRPPIPPIVPPLTENGNVWEEQTSPLVRSFPHCALIGIQFHMISANLIDHATHAPCFFSSADYDQWVDVLPVPAAEALADANPEKIESIVTSITAGAPEDSVAYTRDALHKLQQLAILAKQSGGFVCLHGSM